MLSRSKFPAWPCKTSSPYIGLCVLLSRNPLQAVTQVSVSAWGTEAHPACNERRCRRARHFINTLKYPHADEREHGTSRMRPAHENQRKTHINPHRDMNESGSTFDFCGSVVIWPWPLSEPLYLSETCEQMQTQTEQTQLLFHITSRTLPLQLDRKLISLSSHNICSFWHVRQWIDLPYQ